MRRMRIALLCFVALPLIFIAFALYKMSYIDGDPAPKTKAVIMLHEELAIEYKKKTGRYPNSISDMIDWSPRDGWGRKLSYRPAINGQGGYFYSVGENGFDEQGSGDDIRGAILP
jgi:hypothetical protein